MTQSEFSLIDHFFKARGAVRNDVSVAIGDDGAVSSVPDGYQLVTAVDTLVNGVHFPVDSKAFDIGYKALAVNLSDLAAMGAEPAWATLALTMPNADESWLQQFCDGFFQLAEEFNVQLIGGDTTQGPLSVTVQVMGLVPQGQAVLRSGAKTGDAIYVSGCIGDAALGLRIHQQQIAPSSLSRQQSEALCARLYRPYPRVALGKALRGIASSMIDVSDGLAADLIHILDASRVGATIELENIPVSDHMQAVGELVDTVANVLGGGDDYELCFTVPEDKTTKLADISQQLSLNVKRIGAIKAGKGLSILKNGLEVKPRQLGFEHFSQS